MDAPNQLTLRELQLSIKSALTDRFPLAVWVSAEISELKVNYSGHCYLELVEKGARDGVAQAQARAVIWRNSYSVISSYFEQQTGQRLASGLKVLVKVLVNFHEIYGLSLQITDIDPTYTIGEVERERQRSIAQLQSDGVWDMNRSLPLPRLVQRLAVVSSANAAGYQDFCEEIGRCGYYFSLTLFDAFMQGAGAEESIISALESIAQSSQVFDAVVIIRGGGSSSDLRCFDSYRLASHVAQFPLSIFAGIGHDKDVSVVDMVAAVTLKTPTAVATFLANRVSEEYTLLDNAALALHDAATQITRTHLLTLESLRSDINGRARQKIESEAVRIENIITTLPTYIEQFISQQRSRLDVLTSAVELQSPENLLRLGYAVARLSGGEVLKSCEGIGVGDSFTLSLCDGEVIAEVKKIKKI